MNKYESIQNKTNEIKFISYDEMFEEAADHINSNDGLYKGYRGGNALSLYVNDNFNVNSVADYHAGEARKRALDLLSDAED